MTFAPRRFMNGASVSKVLRFPTGVFLFAAWTSIHAGCIAADDNDQTTDNIGSRTRSTRVFTLTCQGEGSGNLGDVYNSATGQGPSRRENLSEGELVYLDVKSDGRYESIGILWSRYEDFRVAGMVVIDKALTRTHRREFVAPSTGTFWFRTRC
jgi:hypothetical protein